MNLDKLILELDVEDVIGVTNVKVNGIQYDSRKVKKNNIFVAIDGFKVDGHDYIENALDNGAIAVILEKDVNINSNVAIIKVKDSRKALAKLSSAFYDNPSRKIELIGVTGTNGKTSVTYIIDSILRASNKKTGIIGTVGTYVNGIHINTKNTTPESLELQQIFSQLVKAGTDCCVMEVSSHSLNLSRVDYCDFKVGIFTNLTKEHLDYHNNMENYYNAKKKLFYKTSKCNIINIDDDYGRELIKEISTLNTPLYTYGIKYESDIFATDIQYSATGVSFNLNTPKGNININMNIPGVFTVYNSLAAASCAYVYGVDLKDIKLGLEQIKGVKGRFEVIPTNRDFTVIIDYAHTADALEKVLKAIDDFAEGRKVIVFGAGGDRDISKRAPMGEVAGSYCDLCIVTSDNPRTENPQKIINDVVAGINKSNGKYITFIDRKEAIEYAIKNSKPKDIILLAGKGHETYTIIGDKTLPFDEKNIVLDILKDL